MTLVDILAAVAEKVPYLRASTVADGEDWQPCAELVNDRSVLACVIDATMPGFGTSDPAVAASLFTQAYAFRLAGVALAAYALGLPVPDTAPEVTAVRVDKPRPSSVAHLVSRTQTMNADEISQHVVAGHLDRFVAAVHDKYRVGERLLLGNAASSCAVAFRAVEGVSGEQRTEVRTRADAFMAATPSFAGLGQFNVVRAGTREGWYWDRTSCCLWFRAAAGSYCDNCSLTESAALAAQRVRELTEASP
jgi:ferric iron reductase protein FhuF